MQIPKFIFEFVTSSIDENFYHNYDKNIMHLQQRQKYNLEAAEKHPESD